MLVFLWRIRPQSLDGVDTKISEWIYFSALVWISSQFLSTVELLCPKSERVRISTLYCIFTKHIDNFHASVTVLENALSLNIIFVHSTAACQLIKQLGVNLIPVLLSMLLIVGTGLTCFICWSRSLKSSSLILDLIPVLTILFKLFWLACRWILLFSSGNRIEKMIKVD